LIAKIYSEENESLFIALERIKNYVFSDFDTFDFLIISLSPKYDADLVNSLIKKIFKTENYLAFNALSAFNDCNIVNGVTVCVIKFENKGKLSTYLIEGLSEDSAKKLANYFSKKRDNLNIMLSTFSNGEMGYFIEKVSSYLDFTPVNNIIGGITSGEIIGDEFRSYIYSDNKLIKDGCAILTFENIDFAIDISLGFVNYGITYRITKAKDNKIYEVDNKPFSPIIKDILKGINDFDIKYLWYVPINILDEENGYVATLRTIKDFDEEKVEFFGPVKEGQRFRMSFATYENLLNEDSKIANNIKNKLGIPDLIFNFSCIAREYLLEDKKELENKVYIKTLNSHLFGFFTFGEIGPDKKYRKLKLYNETSLLLGVKEK